jgi:hypothetical protein
MIGGANLSVPSVRVLHGRSARRRDNPDRRAVWGSCS